MNNQKAKATTYKEGFYLQVLMPILKIFKTIGVVLAGLVTYVLTKLTLETTKAYKTAHFVSVENNKFTALKNFYETHSILFVFTMMGMYYLVLVIKHLAKKYTVEYNEDFPLMMNILLSPYFGIIYLILLGIYYWLFVL